MENRTLTDIVAELEKLAFDQPHPASAIREMLRLNIEALRLLDAHILAQAGK